jgi:hypothetical protein
MKNVYIIYFNVLVRCIKTSIKLSPDYILNILLTLHQPITIRALKGHLNIPGIYR